MAQPHALRHRNFRTVLIGCNRMVGHIGRRLLMHMQEPAVARIAAPWLNRARVGMDELNGAIACKAMTNQSIKKRGNRRVTVNGGIGPVNNGNVFGIRGIPSAGSWLHPAHRSLSQP